MLTTQQASVLRDLKRAKNKGCLIRNLLQNVNNGRGPWVRVSELIAKGYRIGKVKESNGEVRYVFLGEPKRKRAA